MLSAKHRFHGYGSLNKVYSNGLSVRGNYISLRYKKRTNPSYRVAVVVGKKVHKSAVKRNRMRRRTYEAVRNSKVNVNGNDLIFTIYNEKIIDLSDSEIKTAIDELLIKIDNNN
jgi:ribonuclease P protein component